MKERNVTLFIAFVLLLGMLGQAQEYPTSEIFGGFSYLNTGDGSRESLFGWQSSVTGNFSRTVGLTADFGGQYRSRFGTTLQGYEVLFGPRFTKRGERFTGFVHALFGVEHARAAGISDTGLAMGFGGGLDVNASDRIAIRVFQVDYIPNRFSGSWFHDARVGVGVVFKFGVP